MRGKNNSSETAWRCADLIKLVHCVASRAPLMKALDNISRADDAHHAIKAFISACGIGSRSSWT